MTFADAPRDGPPVHAAGTDGRDGFRALKIVLSGRKDTHEVLLHPVRHRRGAAQRQGVFIIGLDELLGSRMLTELIKHLAVLDKAGRDAEWIRDDDEEVLLSSLSFCL